MDLKGNKTWRVLKKYRKNQKFSIFPNGPIRVRKLSTIRTVVLDNRRM